MRNFLLSFAAMGIVVSFCPQLAYAQEEAAKTGIARISPAFELKAHNINRDRQADINDSLRINNLDIKIDISGSIVQTTLAIDFGNPTNQTLEGDLKISLPKGAYVIGYGLDVNGIMTDGVLQQKQKAREAYEENLRRGVDPGLGEINDANQFTTKVFPIFPNQGRKVKFIYVTSIGSDGKFELPMTTASQVGKTNISINYDGNPALELRAPNVLRVQKSNANTFNLSADETQLIGTLSLGGIVQANKLNLSRHTNGEEFFELIVKGEEGQQAKPQSVRIFWDSSRSRKTDGIVKERLLIKEYIEKFKPTSVELVSFNDETPVISRFNRPSGEQISAAIEAINYTGATRIKDLEKAINTRADICLFVSDGNISIDNFGIEKYPCRLFSISNSPNMRRDILDNIADQNQGSFINLIENDVNSALSILEAKGSGVRNIKSETGAEVPFLVRPIGANFYRIIGQKPKENRIKIEFPNRISELAISPQNIFDNNGAGTLWGANKLELLSATDAPDDNKLLAMVRKYNIATRDYSYIVLETGRDYANNEIAPPKNAPSAIMREYSENRDRLAREKDDAAAQRFGEIHEAWEEHKEWWNKSYLSLGEIKKRRGLNQNRGRDGANETVVVTGSRGAPPTPVMAPPPAPPAPPQPPRATDAQADVATHSLEVPAEAVIVTGTRRASTPEQRQNQSNISIQTAEWNPERPYLQALSKVAKSDVQAFAASFKAQEIEYGDTPAFYFDMAEWAWRNGFNREAARIARNALELPNTNIDTKIMLAQRLLRYGDYENAVWLNQQVLRLTPNKPQARRNLALSLAEKADASLKSNPRNKSGAISEYEIAINLLNEIALNPNSDDYDGIELIAITEANRIIAKLRALGVSQNRLNRLLDPKLTALLDVDIRVVLEWNTDKSDMDLWVDEPSGERAIYSNPKTELGGKLSNDMTMGYGPEEYLLRRAPNGTYKVLSNVFAADRLDPNGPSNLRVTLYRDWGRSSEKRETFVIEATKKNSSDGIEIGSFIKR